MLMAIYLRNIEVKIPLAVNMEFTVCDVTLHGRALNQLNNILTLLHKLHAFISDFLLDIEGLFLFIVDW